MEGKKTLQPGVVLHGKKDYTITSVLGEGGYGVTYLAQHTQPGHNIPDRYAIKEFFLPKCCQRNADGSVTMNDTENKSAKEYRKAFKVEAEHLMDMNKYSGIVHVQEIFETNGTVYYVMEHLGDTSLSNLMKNSGGKIDEELAMHLTESVGKSLAILHQNKMNHLDVKPDNIMLVGSDMQKQPVLIDFGLSRHYNIMGKVTNENSAMGFSDGYSPAEQYVGLDNFSPTADVYALAATLFHMLTGHAPERATKVSEQYLRKELGGKTSEQRIDAIVKAMRMNAAERTQTIDVFLADLGIKKDVVPSSGGTVDISTQRKKKVNWIYVAGIAVIAVLVAVVVMLMGSDRKDGPQPVEEVAKTDTIVKQDTISKQNDDVAEKKEEVKETLERQENNATDNKQIQEKKEKQDIERPKPETKSGPVDLGYALWSGETKNGKPHGYGTMTYKSDRLVDSRDASGTYAAAGDKMKGEFRNGHWEYGTLYSASGSKKASISIGAE